VKIRTAIFGVYVAASAVGLAVLMRFMLAEVRPRYVDSLQRTLHDTARLVAAGIEMRADADPAAAELSTKTNYATLRRAASGVRVRLLDRARTVVFDSQEPVNAAAEPYDGGLARRLATRAIDEDVAPDDGELSAEEPVRVGGQAIGAVVVSRPLHSVNAFIWSERKKLARDALLVALAMVAAGWWISAKLTQSIERLTRHVQDVRDGRPSRPPDSRAAEIATLSRAFEEMRATIEGKAYVERYTQALTHEIKAPLAAIRGAAELLGEDMPDEDRRRFLDNLRTETARIQRIVDRMLELSALEARHGRIERETFALEDVVREVVAGASAAAEAREVRFTVVAADAAAMLQGERFLVAQAVSNLVQNALEFTPRGGAVAVSLRRDHDRARVTVDDTGPGVPDYALTRLGERFYSLPRPDTGRKSTGLGLSIVREIARLHGGDVSLENRPEGGARATLWLDLA
jgi:two-component system sensor histidine kinase CreC